MFFRLSLYIYISMVGGNNAMGDETMLLFVVSRKMDYVATDGIEYPT